jgi:Domain of unknown function (DUF4382)
MKTSTLIVSISIVCLLAGCGGGGDSPAATAPLSVRLTDAQADPAVIDRVCLEFSRITVHYAGGEDVVIDYDPLPSQISDATHCPEVSSVSGVRAVRLSALGGPLTVALVDSVAVPVGRIAWIRLHLVPGGSYLLENGGGMYVMSNESLRCPSCEMTDNNAGRGFKLNRTFEVPDGGLAVTIDVDLGVSLSKDANGYVLRPTARIERDDTLGTIAGEVSESALMTAGGTPAMGPDPDTGCAVYVFEDATDPLEDFSPGSPVVTTARVRLVDFGLPSEHHAYAAGALPQGRYTVALTCDEDTEAAGESVTFYFTDSNVAVVAAQTTPKDFL